MTHSVRNIKKSDSDTQFKAATNCNISSPTYFHASSKLTAVPYSSAVITYAVQNLEETAVKCTMHTKLTGS